jgi:DNA mismatch repair protein MutS
MIYDEYVCYTTQYKKEYGPKTIVLIEIGSFLEMYNCNENNGADLKEVGELLNIQVSKKNKNVHEVSVTNPQMAGFPTPALPKFLPLMIDNGYTVVLVSQVTLPPNPKRAVTHVYSKGTQLDNIKSSTQNIMCLYMEPISIHNSVKRGVAIGVSIVDLTTGKCYASEHFPITNDLNISKDEVYKLVASFNPCEVIFIGDDDVMKVPELINYLGLSSTQNYDMTNIYNREVHDIRFQNHMLSLAYPCIESMLSPIEYVDMERSPVALVSFVHLLRYAYRHNSVIVSSLDKPIMLSSEHALNLSFNAVKQLDIEGLCTVINRCVTSQGKRYFKHQLVNPYRNTVHLQKMYNNCEEFVCDPELCMFVQTSLRTTYDLERLVRKMQLGKIQPGEMSNVVQTLNTIFQVDVRLNTTCQDIVEFDEPLNTKILQVQKHVESWVRIDECSKYNINEFRSNIFVKGRYEDIEQIENSISLLDNDISSLMMKLNNGYESTYFKLENNERDGYHIVITNKRYNEIIKSNKVTHNGFTLSTAKAIPMQSSYIKLTDPYLKEYTTLRADQTSLLHTMVLEKYIVFVQSFGKRYESVLKQFNAYICLLDYVTTNARNAIEFCYSKPIIKDDAASKSYIRAKALRHPLIERLTRDIDYVPNDIELGSSNSIDGMLLYGLNAAGKSSLMKAVGLSIIMAQCGMFVPSSNFTYFPYESLFTRIDKQDNIFMGQSTFMVEMAELRNILKRATTNSLVIGDELCSGTESASAIAIVAAGILELSNKRSSFIFATHHHDLTNISRLKGLTNLVINHLHVSYDPLTGTLVYDRTLKPGQGSTNYGIEVCRALDLGDEFVKVANEIRNEHLQLTNTMNESKRSRYNTSVIVDKCQVCGKKAMEVHHIKQQKDADHVGNVGIKHKNHASNLVPLCEECHNQVHHGELVINGYIHTSIGRRLDVSQVKKNEHDEEHLKDTIIKFRFEERLSFVSIRERLRSLGQDASEYKIKKIIKSHNIKS